MNKDVELFCKCYLFLFKSKALSIYDALVLNHYIWRNTGPDAPYPASIEWVAKNSGISHASVERSTQKLVKMNLVKISNVRGRRWCTRIVITPSLDEIKRILQAQNIGPNPHTEGTKKSKSPHTEGSTPHTEGTYPSHRGDLNPKFNSEVPSIKQLINSGTDPLDIVLDNSLDIYMEPQNFVVDSNGNNLQINSSESANAPKRKYAPMVVKSKVSTAKKSVGKHSQSTLVNVAQEKKKVLHKDSLYLAKKLAEAISFPEENSKSLPERYLTVWPKSFNNIIQSDKIDKNECEQLIEWYKLNKTFDMYIPKIRTAKEFGEKIQKLRDAVTRVGNKQSSNPFPWMDTPLDEDEIKYSSKVEEYIGSLPLNITDKKSLCNKLSKWYCSVCMELLPYVDTELRDPDGGCTGICLAKRWHSRISIDSLADSYGDYIRETSEKLTRASQASFEPPSGKLFRSYIQEITSSWELDITHPDIGLMGFRDTSN